MFERMAKYWRRPAVDSKAETGMRVNLLCAASVFSVSLWLVAVRDAHNRDTENTEAAQRNPLDVGR